MSKHHPTTREELKEFCLRRLGKPVIQINVAPEQLEDCISEAIDYFQLEHYNGSETLYYPVTITQEMINAESIPIDPIQFIGVIRLLETTAYGSGDWATLGWQIGAAAYNGTFTLAGHGLLNYVQVMSYQNTLKLLVSGRTKDIRFVRHTGQIKLDTNWANLKVGQFLVAEVVRRVDPDEHPEAYNDPWLKEYTTALIGEQWGTNLVKLNNVQMIGGVQINGEAILSQWQEVKNKLRDNMLLASQEPLDFYMG